MTRPVQLMMTRTDHVFHGDDAGVDDPVAPQAAGVDECDVVVGVLVCPDCVCQHIANVSLSCPNG